MHIIFNKASVKYWNELEEFIGEPLPHCVKYVLSLSGYDTIFSLVEMNDKQILEIEDHISTHEMEKIKTLTCCHSDYYTNKVAFKCLPGHATILLALPKYIEKYSKSITRNIPNCHLPFILKEMITTAEQNMYKDKNHASYSDAIRFFATYIILLCGRSCYEMLRVNLPFPSVKTLCKLT